MRILEIVADGNPGGGTTHVLKILSSLGQSFEFGLVTQTASHLLSEAKRLGIPCFGLDFFRSRLDLSLRIGLRRICALFQPDIIHVHGGRAGLSHVLASTKIPTIYTVHGFHFVHKHPVLRWLAMTTERLIISRAHRTIFVSHYDDSVARKHRLVSNDYRSTVIYNGVTVRHEGHANPKSNRNIGFIGRLEYEKDPLLFLDIIERLPEYVAIVVGGGALACKVRDEIGRRRLTKAVQMAGPLSHPETLQILSTLSAVVMTSRWEGLPFLPLEAMMSGVPVVAAKVGGMDEIIENMKSGLLVEGRSADAFAMAIVQVTQDMEFRKGIIENGRHRVRSLFSEDRMLSEIQRMYKELSMP